MIVCVTRWHVVEVPLIRRKVSVFFTSNGSPADAPTMNAQRIAPVSFMNRELVNRWGKSSGLTALTLGVIAITALVHLFGIRLISRVNNVGVWTELLGVTALSLVLIGIALARGASSAMVLNSTNAVTAQPAGLGAWAL